MLLQLAVPNVVRNFERAYGPFVHMSQGEKAVWTRWLMAGGFNAAPFWYDVRVGEGLQMPQHSSGYAIRSAYALTTKRIDVVFRDKSDVWVVEVKVRAGASAIGQLITYRDLFHRDNPEYPLPKMLLVAETLQPDMIPVLQQTGIEWRVV